MRGKGPGHKYTWWIFIRCSNVGVLYVYTIIVIIIEEKVRLRPSYRKLFFDPVEESTHTGRTRSDRVLKRTTTGNGREKTLF